MASYQSVVNINIIMKFLIGHKAFVSLSHSVLLSLMSNKPWLKLVRKLIVPFKVSHGNCSSKNVGTMLVKYSGAHKDSSSSSSRFGFYDALNISGH